MKILVANWKSHKTAAQAHQWLNDVEGAKLTGVQLIVAPPFPLIPLLTQAFDRTKMSIAAQDVSPFPMGSYTGAVSAETLTSVGVTHVIVGHSERRQYFHETSAEVANKVREALEAGLTPIVCVDEPYLREQLATLEKEVWAKCWFAYEPLEAIGSGQNQPIEEVRPVIKLLKKECGAVPVLYGGSVDPENVGEYLAETDGVLVGHASLKAAECLSLAKKMGKK